MLFGSSKDLLKMQKSKTIIKSTFNLNVLIINCVGGYSAIHFHLPKLGK